MMFVLSMLALIPTYFTKKIEVETDDDKKETEGENPYCEDLESPKT